MRYFYYTIDEVLLCHKIYGRMVGAIFIKNAEIYGLTEIKKWIYSLKYGENAQKNPPPKKKETGISGNIANPNKSKPHRSKVAA